MGFSEYQEESEDGQTIGDYTDYVYGGAPDECNVHWPTKLNADGYCPIVGCRFYVRVPDTFSELGDCTPDDSGYCSGGCVTRPHVWSASGARCTRTDCNVAGTGDQCNDGNCHGRD